MFDRRATVTSYGSKEEQACAALLQTNLHWKPHLGITYQRPISARHDADFFLPEQNLILEYHPPVIKWYGADGVYSRLKRLQRTLSTHEYAEVQDLLSAQITHEYTRRRRSIMDLSDVPNVSQMKLVVADSPQTFYRDIIRPYAHTNITLDQFKTQWSIAMKRK